MKRLLSEREWKVCLVACTLLVLGLAAFSLLHSPVFFGPSKVGTLGVELIREPSLGSRRHVIESLQVDSPLRAAGADVGDRLEWDSWLGPISSKPGDEVGLTLYKANATRHIVATLIESSDSRASPATTQYLALTYGLTGVIFGLLIGFKRPDADAYRSLALGFLFLPLVYFPELSSPGISRIVTTIFHDASYLPTWGGYLLFALLYPGDKPQGLRARLYRMRAFPIAALSFFVIYVLLTDLGGWSLPYHAGVGRVAVFITGAMIIAALVEGWLGSQRDLRTRHLWVLIAFGIKIGILEATWLSLLTSIDVFLLLQLFAHLLILYAILRHRILDFSFILNRALVYSISSVLLLVSFGIIEWLVERLLHFESREKNMVLDGGIAVGLVFVFHRFHHRVDHAINRTIFQRWFANEAALRLFVKRAAFITQSDALHREFGSELQRFTGGARCLIYKKSGAGDFELVYESLSGAPNRVPVDDSAAVAMRAEDSPLALRDFFTLVQGEWVFPMTHRATLHGFVVLDSKPNGESYRPDELDVIRFAVRNIGLDLRAMEVQLLESKIERLSLETQVLRDQLQDPGQPRADLRQRAI